jgi:hypothetical protein
MRKIEFRGKAVVGNNWVNGYFYKIGTFCYIMKEDGVSISVVEETVGQLVPDIPDKNGHNVFEGDIVEVNYSDPYSPRVMVISHGGPLNSAGFGMIFKKDTPMWDTLNYGHSQMIKVIGNIHDNPELWGKVKWELTDKREFETKVDIQSLGEDDGEFY